MSLEVAKPPLHPQGFKFYLKFKTSRRRRSFFAKTHFIFLRSCLNYGRVTIIALNMNNEIIVDSRKKWVLAGSHPPQIINLKS